MKKVLFLFITIVMITVIAACGDDTEDNDDPTVLTTNRTDALELTADYEGKSFLEDGIGVVELHQCIDGDTTHFREGRETFSIRYIGVDTPESTASLEPWGKAASDFVCEVLTDADEIVLEWDSSLSGRTGTYGRLLAFIWYDGRLLNLELVELAYSPSSAMGTKYGETMQNAWYDAQKTGRRIYGEIDPDYDYSIDGQEISIEELRENRELYVGRRITVQGVITNITNTEFYLEQDGHEIMVYAGYSYQGPHIVLGNEIRLENMVPTYFPLGRTDLGSLQLSDFNRHNVELISEAEQE